MSEECKKARNTVLIPLVLLVSLLVFLSSCGSTYTSCAAYASIEVKNEAKWRILRNQLDA